MPDSARAKISMFANVDLDQVICVPDVNNIYRVPTLLFENRVAHRLADRLGLNELQGKLNLENAVQPKNSLGADDVFKSNQFMEKWFELYNR